MILARVYIRLKPTVNDPQGLTIMGGLKDLGYDAVRRVRAGKYMELTLEGVDRETAARQVAEMCERLLANPIIEEYSFQLEELAEGREAALPGTVPERSQG